VCYTARRARSQKSTWTVRNSCTMIGGFLEARALRAPRAAPSTLRTPSTPSTPSQGQQIEGKSEALPVLGFDYSALSSAFLEPRRAFVSWVVFHPKIWRNLRRPGLIPMSSKEATSSPMTKLNLLHDSSSRAQFFSRY